MLENTMPHLAPHDRCTGCAACASGCPRGAIHMLPDREGFLRPTITDACIQCGHCSHICPVLKQRERRSEPAAFAVWNEDESVRALSGSGGAFSLLAEYILDDGGVVFGAALDENLKVRHIPISSKAHIHRLRGPKLVQSEIGDSYQLVRRCLDRGYRVLFTGTPCQVDGLYRYLGEHPEKLLTCDILCGGVPSPGVWEHLVRSMAYIKQKKPLSVSFCAKGEGGKDRRFRVEFEGGSAYDAPLTKSEFGCGLHRRLFLRPSCHDCPYMSCDRVGDLSLGHYRGLPKDVLPDEQKKGVSLLLVNSPKGAHMFDTLPLKKEKRPLTEAAAANSALTGAPAASDDRTAFFDAYARQSFQQVREKFLQVSPLPSPRRKAAPKEKKKFTFPRIFRKKEQ
ncbi:MAG: Coenzyme F420 hydrogenase/dehydrogenase, beta subunit C-terminal domain [Oscillospiraceae bacterium]|nr:Coenzyme F420 hydrogenase/dehydrogenase, beta subunit C-terminal domain [Oscillospiraceae bacterium]